ncbi:hypothetical protein SAMN05421504_104232 [Amycolatopsis xylanica]|uniref:Uncharacterized protein n=1 Tax=Amycolatopsis xylanica TaxID=589385 RepID=A0A1H3GFE4_9PSEU|nr:hypothetical protein SAMN05421504_104232 [Amycolatopsis xylanica]
MNEIADLQRFSQTENAPSNQPEGCCGLGSYVTCPWRTFD